MDRRLARVNAARERLIAEHLDALLVSSLPNIRYLTGFSGSNALVLLDHNQVVLITDFRYKTQIVDDCSPWVETRVEQSSLWAGVWESLGATASKALGFESNHVAHKDFQRLLEQGTRWHWRPVEDVIEDLRAVKDTDEVECIRRAGAVATQALGKLMEGVYSGLTELEVCGRLERALREAGSEAHPFPPIVAGGERAALPHARASSREIQRGDFLLIDFGATVGGYCSDITRTFSIGRPSTRQASVYYEVAEAHRKALEGVRAGLTGREADSLARDSLTAAGYGEFFGHGLGHGLGLEVHESPRLSRLAESVLKAGSVVTIEPGVYVPGWGGVRLEDDVYVTEAGVELLTEFPRDLAVLDS